jgi:drug/metabolite transporter (DMT)-like permease
VAQTKRKRRRKHRGTPAGTVERAGRTGRPQTRDDAKRIARQRRTARLSRPPTWRGAVNRAAVAALVFGVLLAALFRRDVAQASALAAFMFIVYIPLGYITDRAIFNMRQRRQERARK